MKNEKLIRAIGTLDDDLILRAERGVAKRYRLPKSLRVAACIAAIAILGIGVCAAAGLLPGNFFKHFSIDGETDLYQEQIMAAITSASNEDLEIRVDGAVMDGRQCLVVFTTKALSTKGENFLNKDKLPLEIAAVLKDGAALDLEDWSYSYHSGSRIAGTREASYLLEIRPTNFKVSQIETLNLHFQDPNPNQNLNLELKMQHHLTDSVMLQSEESNDFSIVEMSPLGIYLELPVTDPGQENILEQQSNMEIRLILADGTFSDDYALEGTSMYNTVQNKIHVYENFVVIDERTLKIAMVDLDNFSGLQIDEINYYITESMPEN